MPFRRLDLDPTEPADLRQARLEQWLADSVHAHYEHRRPRVLWGMLIMFVVFVIGYFADVNDTVGPILFVFTMLVLAKYTVEERLLRRRAKAKGLEKRALRRFDTAVGQEGTEVLDQWREEVAQRVLSLQRLWEGSIEDFPHGVPTARQGTIVSPPHDAG